MSKAVIFTAADNTDWIDEIVPIYGRRRTQSKPSGDDKEKGVDTNASGQYGGSSVRDVAPTSYMKSVDISPTGGNPGAFRQTVVQSEDDEGVKEPRNVYIKNLNNQAIYEPSVMGPITSIECSFDVLNVEIAKLTKVQYSLLVEQDGALFQSATAKVPRKKEWRGFVLNNLVAEDFDRLPVSAPIAGSPARRHPNFVNGGPVRFGYLLRASAKATAVFAITGIDNWRVTLVTKRIDMTKSKELARSLLVERSERQKLESQLKEEREKAEVLLRQSLSMDVSRSVSDIVVPRPVEPSSPTRAVVPTAEDEAKRKQYVSIVAAARKRLVEAQGVHQGERDKWNQQQATLAEKQLALEKALEAERDARASQQMMFSSQFEEVNAVFKGEKQKLGRDLTEKDATIQEYSERIARLERELREQSKNRSMTDENLQQAREDVQSLKKAVSAHNKDKASMEERLGQSEATVKALQSELNANVEALQELEARLESAQSEQSRLDNKCAELIAQCELQEEQLRESQLRVSVGEAEHKRKIDDLVEQCEAVSSALSQKCQEMSALESHYANEIAHKDEQMARLEAELQDLSAVCKQLNTEVEQDRLLQQKSQSHILELSAKLQEQTAKANSTQDEAAIVNNQLADEMARRVELESCTASLEEQLKRSESSLQAERERVSSLEMELESLRDRHSDERAMKERVASEMMNTLNVRKEVEERQAATIAFLTEQLRNQAKEADEAINAHIAAREKAEQALRIEIANRESAETAVEQLSQLLGMGQDDDTWEVVAPSEPGAM